MSPPQAAAKLAEASNSFSGAFVALLLASAYLGLAPNIIPTYKQSDKVLHLMVFFLLTISFYWILETNRRRNLHLTLLVCTLVLAVGSEIVQGLLHNGREFDSYDVLANIVGSGAGVFLCTWYHKRMLDRKRAVKYNAIPGEDGDVELGGSDGTDHGNGQETGITGTARSQTLEEEVDNWDENDEEWDEDDPTSADGEGQKTPSSSVEDPGAIAALSEPRKRAD